MKSGVWREQTAIYRKWYLYSSSWFFIIFTIMISLLVGIVTGLFGSYALAVVIGSMILALIIIFRQDELAAVLVLAIHLNIDWYLGSRVISLVLSLVLLCAYYIGRSPPHPWVKPRYLWLWALFLGFTIIPAVRGATDLFNTIFYYPNLIFGALLMFWVGTIIARSPASIRLFFRIFSFYSMLVAIHTIIQSRTGVFLFNTVHNDAYYAQQSYNHLPGMPDISRAGSFFIDPNWASTFFAMTLFIPLGLLLESSSPLAKILYLVEAILIALAMLFTYSAGSWLAATVAAVTFIVLLGGVRYHAQFLLCLSAAVIVVLIGFSSSFNLLLQHTANPIELTSRIGAWQTALRVISAFPLTGVGLGEQTYLVYSLPYIVPAQLIPLVHPHNSYLEWAAMAGLPVLIVFVALLVFNMRWALHNWAQSEPRSRCLLAAGMAAVIALSFNSFSINGWTFPALSAIGWLILGAIASPLLSRKLSTKAAVERKS
jgi:O-Antigen ligase